MSPEPTEEEMRRLLFGADEPIAQENAPPAQKASQSASWATPAMKSSEIIARVREVVFTHSGP